MLVLSVAALVLHGVVVYQGVLFFRKSRRGRDDDRHVVALLMTVSVVFLLMQTARWVLYLPQDMGDSLWVGFAVCNGAVYVGMIRQYVRFRSHRDRRACIGRVPQ